MLIHPYNPEWAQRFREIEEILLEALHGLNVNLEHVGSTAVPGLVAKPIIDIDVIFRPDVDFEAISNRLRRIGYFHNGDQGVRGREAFRRNRADNRNEVLDRIAHHLYVCPFDSPALENHLLFRDYLKENEWARKAYQKLKYQLADETYQDKKAYARLKEVRATDLVLGILEKARGNMDAGK